MAFKMVAFLVLIISSLTLFIYITKNNILTVFESESNKCYGVFNQPSYIPIPMHNYSKYSQRYSLYYYMDESKTPV